MSVSPCSSPSCLGFDHFCESRHSRESEGSREALILNEPWNRVGGRLLDGFPVFADEGQVGLTTKGVLRRVDQESGLLHKLEFFMNLIKEHQFLQALTLSVNLNRGMLGSTGRLIQKKAYVFNLRFDAKQRLLKAMTEGLQPIEALSQ